MLVSIHIPKTAGTSFGQLLKDAYGARCLFDYGDWAGYDAPEARAHRAQRKAAMLQNLPGIVRDYDCIHGHFLARKYAGEIPGARFVAFFRDPYQQALSNYEYVRRNPQVDNPIVRIFHERKMTLWDYLSWPEIANVQARLLDGIGLEDLTCIGLTERFAESLACVNAAFGLTLSDTVRENLTPERGADHAVEPEIAALISRTRAPDIAIYARARERFERQSAELLR